LKTTITVNGDHTAVALHGNLSEECEEELLELRNKIATPKVTFDCGDLKYINSYGMARWIHFITDLGKRARLEYDNCPVNFVEFVGIIPVFLGGGTIRSLLMTYCCDECGLTTTRKVDRDAVAQDELPASVECEKCRGKAVADVDLDTFLTILAKNAH
jgi:hypothetical protein